LSTPELPPLNGCLCQVFNRTEGPGLIEFDKLDGADWYISRPEIHLGSYLESWVAELLSVVKLFFFPTLQWWCHETNFGFERFRKEYDEILIENVDAKAKAFARLNESFINEAGVMLAETINFANAPAPPQD
jgi:hypothetical protein